MTVFVVDSDADVDVDVVVVFINGRDDVAIAVATLFEMGVIIAVTNADGIRNNIDISGTTFSEKEENQHRTRISRS